MKICLIFAHPQDIQDIDEVAYSSEQIMDHGLAFWPEATVYS